jgi:hypothetical protein
MRQTTLSVVLEVTPASLGQLQGLIEKVKHDEENSTPPLTQTYDRLKWGVPTLHFMSLSVFQGPSLPHPALGSMRWQPQLIGQTIS